VALGYEVVLAATGATRPFPGADHVVGSSRASPWGAAGARERSLGYPKLWDSPVWASTTIVRF
jgi:hypothetical protein